MPELDLRPVENAKRAPAAAGGMSHATPVGWWPCVSYSRTGPAQTVGVMLTEPGQLPCDVTGLVGRDWLPVRHTSWAALHQATEILHALPDAPAEVVAGDMFADVWNTLVERRLREWPPRPPSTSIVSDPPYAVGRAQGSRPPATLTLRDLMRSIGGSAELLSELLGASRRSIYNWLKGKPVRAEFATRAERLQLVLVPLREDWHPQALAEWLQAGDPSPAQLAVAQRWAELEERVRDAQRPLQPQARQDDEDAAAGSLEPWPAEALVAVLDEFRSPPPAPGREISWRPRELTGLTPEHAEE
jgi:hypothetical protein